MKMVNPLTSYFQLIEVFTIREIKSRYRGSILGPLWIVLYPLIVTVILSLVFGVFVQLETGGVPYFVFLFSGLIFWNFFQQGVSLASEVLIWNRDLITKTYYFRRSALPLSYALSKIPDFFVNLVIFLIFYVLNGYGIGSHVFLILLGLPSLILFSSALSLLVSLFNALFRDFGRVFEVFVMILSYATPIIYPETLIPQKYWLFLYANPLSTLVIFVRKILFRNEFDLNLLLISSALSLIAFIISFYIFNKFEKKIADFI